MSATNTKKRIPKSSPMASVKHVNQVNQEKTSAEPACKESDDFNILDDLYQGGFHFLDDNNNGDLPKPR